MYRCTGRRPGFTILEAVVALAIVSVAAVAALGALAADLRTAERSQTALEAASLAQDRLATLELLSRESLRPLPDSLARGQFPQPFERYKWEAVVHDVRADDNLIDVFVRTLWDNGAFELRTRLYRPRLLTAAP